jgi:hypothetical protein
MSKLLVVIGATGKQGGSVIDALLNHGTYKIRGLTRNLLSPESQILISRGVEMVSAEMEDEESLVRAFEGASVIFAVTDFYETFRETNPWIAMETEYRRGTNLAKAAMKTATLEHYVWSTLPSSYKISNRKFFIPHFEVKARVDEYIKSNPDLLKKTTFLWLAFFASNFLKPSFAPVYNPMLKKYLFLLPTPPTSVFGMLGSIANIGVLVRGILQRPACSLPGKYVLGNVESLPLDECFQRWATCTGRQAQYLQVTPEAYNALLPGYGAEMQPMFEFWSEYGEKAWSGEDLVSSKDLNVEHELEGLEQSWRAMDWSVLDRR